MKFTRPINREVDIDGNVFVVTLDENGVTFRLKGKRRSAQASWSRVLDVAEAEGKSARAFLGLSEAPRAETGSEKEGSSHSAVG
jgi:hypothetical protein